MGEGWGEDGGTEQTLKDGRKVEAAAETLLKIRQVAGEVFHDHPMAGAEQADLQVA